MMIGRILASLLKWIGRIILALSLLMVGCSSLILVTPEPTYEEMLSECENTSPSNQTEQALEGCVEDYYKGVAGGDALVILGYVFGLPGLIFFLIRKVFRRFRSPRNP